MEHVATTEFAESTTVGRYLATRLLQLGARHVFGVPGDFNLTLLDELTAVDGLTWVGSSNELNAAYSADGYARVGRRPAAIVTTFGVGELSAVNGIAGSFAEDVPVLHVVGTPATSSARAGAPLHHTFLDGDYARFVRIAQEVTIASSILSERDPGAEIDRVLTAMITASKPAYLGVPLDVARARIAAHPLQNPLRVPASEPRALTAFEAALRRRFTEASGITILAGPRVHRRALESNVAALAELDGVRIASQTGSKAILDERHPASLGTYLGATTRSDAARRAVDDASPLVLIGTVFSDFTTGFFTHGYDPAEAVELALDHARIGHAVYPDVRLEESIAALGRATADARFAPEDIIQSAPALRPQPDRPDAALTHDTLWPEIGDWLAPETTVVAEAGTAFYGVIDLDLPDRSDLLGQPVWSSIGFTLPAAFGAGLARPDRRPVLFIGDGAAQLTIQELGQLFGHGLDPVVFLIDNDGYTVERKIQSPDAVYQDIVRWDWDLVPAALGAESAVVTTVRTISELRQALAAASPRGRGHFIRLLLPKYDAPRLLVILAEGIAATNAN